MKVLLVGPHPPPHGGVSVHIAEMKRRAAVGGVPCRVLNTNRNAAPNPEYISVGRATGFMFNLLKHALEGWTIQIHTNGHNFKSWLVALAGGLAGRFGPGSELTLHSGGMPDYVNANLRRRCLARMTCRLFKKITCVSPRLRDAVGSLGIPNPRIEMTPAFRGMTEQPAHQALSPQVEKWFEQHHPVFSTTASNHPEYGVELLVETVARLVVEHKNAGCVLIGIGEEAKAVRALIERRNLSPSVLMLGDVPHAECLHVISRSAAFVRPTFMDGDSISVREALALGVPVIASDAAARPEGTILFATGNSDDLMKKMACLLEGSLQNFAR